MHRIHLLIKLIIFFKEVRNRFLQTLKEYETVILSQFLSFLVYFQKHLRKPKLWNKMRENCYPKELSKLETLNSVFKALVNFSPCKRYQSPVDIPTTNAKMPKKTCSISALRIACHTKQFSNKLYFRNYCLK